MTLNPDIVAALAAIEKRLEAVETILTRMADDVNDIERDMEKKVPFIGSTLDEAVGQGVETQGGFISGLPESMQKHAKHLGVRDTDPSGEAVL